MNTATIIGYVILAGLGLAVVYVCADLISRGSKAVDA